MLINEHVMWILRRTVNIMRLAITAQELLGLHMKSIKDGVREGTMWAVSVVNGFPLVLVPVCSSIN